MSSSFVLEPAPDGLSIETVQLSRRVSRAAAVLKECLLIDDFTQLSSTAS